MTILFSSAESMVLTITTIVAGILAFSVYRSDQKNTTNKIFVILTFFILAWLVVLYFDNLNPSLLLARLSIFIATPMNFALFLLVNTLPKSTLQLSRKWFWSGLIATIGVMAINISPYAFTNELFEGDKIQVNAGPGIIPFAALSVLFTCLVAYTLIRRIFYLSGPERKQIIIVANGILIMMVLLLSTVLIPVIFFGQKSFTPLAPIYSLVFLAATAYAIVRYRLFNIKIIATEAITLVLSIFLFARLVSPEPTAQFIVDLVVFLCFVLFGGILVRSVQQEVRQREELERLDKELEDKNKQLEDLGRFKSQLLSLASHQIRSPLGAIKGLLSLVVEGDYGPVGAKVKDVLGKVQHSADELISLINTLLDVRKVEEGRMEYQFEKVDVNKIISDVVDLMRPVAEAKKLELSLVLPEKELFVSADAEKFKQVIQNLIDNSIKYTPSGFIRIALKEQGDAAIFSVADSGLGISASLIPHLFEEFIRDERVKKEIRGTGLGLYIARKIVEAHGGRIWAESGGEGKGSTFYVILPRLKERIYQLKTDA